MEGSDARRGPLRLTALVPDVSESLQDPQEANDSSSPNQVKGVLEPFGQVDASPVLPARERIDDWPSLRLHDIVRLAPRSMLEFIRW